MTIYLPKAMKPVTRNREQSGRMRAYAQLIEDYLQAYDIRVKVTEVNSEPSGIQFCLEIALGCAIDDILKQQKELSTILAAPYNRLIIEAPIPGRSLVGITIPWVYPYPEIPPADAVIQRTDSWLFKVSVYFFRLSEKVGGPVLCRISG